MPVCARRSSPPRRRPRCTSTTSSEPSRSSTPSWASYRRPARWREGGGSVSFEHEVDRARSSSEAAPRGNGVEPGQASRSAALDKPAQATASGLVQQKRGDQDQADPGEAAEGAALAGNATENASN